MTHFAEFFNVRDDGRVLTFDRYKGDCHARWIIYPAQSDISPDEVSGDDVFRGNHQESIRCVRRAIKYKHIDKILKGELKADRTRIIVYYPFKYYKRLEGQWFTEKECYVLEIIYCDKIQDGNVVKSVELIENGNPDAPLPKEVNFLLTYLWGLNEPNAIKKHGVGGWYKC